MTLNTPIGAFGVCKQTPLCLSYVISHGCLLRPVGVKRNAFFLYFAPLKYIISKHRQILKNIPFVCLTSYLNEESKIIILGGV